MQREAVKKYARVEQNNNNNKMSSGSSGRNTGSILAPDNKDLPRSSCATDGRRLITVSAISLRDLPDTAQTVSFWAPSPGYVLT